MPTPTPVFPTRALSATGGSAPATADWRTYLSIEDRQRVRKLVKDAYTGHCGSYDELLNVVVGIEEELLHVAAPSRLDYFKSGYEFEKRVKVKQAQVRPVGVSG